MHPKSRCRMLDCKSMQKKHVLHEEKNAPQRRSRGVVQVLNQQFESESGSLWIHQRGALRSVRLRARFERAFTSDLGENEARGGSSNEVHWAGSRHARVSAAEGKWGEGGRARARCGGVIGPPAAASCVGRAAQCPEAPVVQRVNCGGLWRP